MLQDIKLRGTAEQKIILRPNYSVHFAQHCNRREHHSGSHGEASQCAHASFHGVRVRTTRSIYEGNHLHAYMFDRPKWNARSFSLV